MFMPVKDGFQILEQLRSGFPEIPVVVMLDAADNGIAIQAAERGAIQSLIKPIAADALEATASHAIRITRIGHGRSMRFGNERSETRERSSVTATEAKNEFGRILEHVIRGNRVFVTRHDAPKAVLMSVEDFEALSASARSKLDTLSAEFDAVLAQMQARGTRSKMKAAFNATPDQLGRAAVEEANKRD